jgi:hypothetical protein
MPGAKAQLSSSCDDLNGYPPYKNVGTTGAYTLLVGMEEKAAQTYHYSGLGKLTSIRIFGSTPNLLGVNLIARIYNVDASGRPTTIIGSRSFQWWMIDNKIGFKDVNFPFGGYLIKGNFAVSVEIDGGFPMISEFQLTYTGNGEGNAEDLASLAGTSTGFNWASAKSSFSKDGDFYILPKVKNYITSEFHAGTSCANISETVSFTNSSSLCTDGMFNRIGLPNYSGSKFFYTWNYGDGSPADHAANPSHAFSAAGVYTVSLTCTIDGWTTVCSSTTTRRVSVGLNASATNLVNVNCFGSSNGSFTALGTGGATPYSYNINGSDYKLTPGFSNLSAGDHVVNIMDAVGCISSMTVAITQPTPIVISTPLTTNASCGTSNGAIQVSATGGNGALVYSLNGTTWQTSGSFQNIPSAGYTISVKDANSCLVKTTVPVNDLGSPVLTLVSFTNASCNSASNGSIVASGSGGSGTLMYSINGTNYQPSGTFNNIPANTYNVSVKDASGCKSNRVVVIAEPPALSFTTAMTPATCNGSSTGQINVPSVIGGTGNMNYSFNGIDYQSSPIFSGLAAGTYTISVKDAAGCVVNTPVAVTQPTAVSATISSANVSCHGEATGSFTALATDGTPGYTYSIDDEFSPTGDFGGLTAGTYTVVIHDALNCSYTTTATITEPAVIKASITTGNATCGNSNGTIAVIGGGGSGATYQYSIDGTNWNNSGAFSALSDSTYVVIVRDGSGCYSPFHATVSDVNGPAINTVSSTNITCSGSNTGTITVTNVTGGSGTRYFSMDGSPWQLSMNFTGLAAGLHVIIVKDGLGCSGKDTLTLTEPAPILVNAAITNLICAGSATGATTITAGGGSGTLAYSIDGAKNWQASNVFSDLQAGHYTVEVKDAGGCIGSRSIEITQPAAINLISSALNVSCSGAANGSISAYASGGTGAIQYSIDGVHYQSGHTFLGLAGGTVNIYAKDANGCIKSMPVNVYEPLPIAVAGNVYNITCAGGNNGAITISEFGGTGPYHFAWSNTATTPAIFNLVAGTYQVIVTDANGCTSTSAFAVSQPANPLVVNAIITNATGNTTTDGAVHITVTGGTLPYTYSWSNGTNLENNINVAPGSYIVSITDANGCVTSGVYNVSSATGINSASATSLAVRLFPNPASSIVTIETGGNNIDHIELINLVGKVVYSADPKSAKVDISINGLADGLYFVQLKVNDILLTKKVEIRK